MASHIDEPRGHRGVIALTLLLATLSLGAPLQGQEGLDAADALASAGRTEEARAILESWWEDDRPSASRRDRQRALWLRAVLTVDPSMAGLDFQRLVLRYPGGPYSDDALTRLGLISAAEGDLVRAADFFRTLVRDYPRSPERRSARAWLSENEREVEEAEAAVREAEAVAEQEAIALEEQLLQVEEELQGGESGADSLSRANLVESAESLEALPVAPTEARLSEAESRYSVQLGAFLSEERARRLMAVAEDAGFATRLVRVIDSDLIHVRVGNFAERAEAVELMRRIREIGYDATIAADVALEEPFG